MRLSGQFHFFFKKRKKKKKKKKNHPLRSFVRQKPLPLLFSVRLFLFCWFALVFVRSKYFCKKIKIVLIASFTALLTYTPINRPIDNLLARTYFYLWSSVRTSSLYENLFESFLFVRISSCLGSSFFNSLRK